MTVTDLAAVGIVNSAWRNSPVEDWHAGGRLSNGEMLRINSYSIWRVREIVRGWRAEVGITEGARTITSPVTPTTPTKEQPTDGGPVYGTWARVGAAAPSRSTASRMERYTVATPIPNPAARPA